MTCAWFQNVNQYHAIPKTQQSRNFATFPESHRQQEHQNTGTAEVFNALCYLYRCESEDAAADRPA